MPMVKCNTCGHGCTTFLETPFNLVNKTRHSSMIWNERFSKEPLLNQNKINCNKWDLFISCN